jgi:uncharacterized membrane protein
MRLLLALLLLAGCAAPEPLYSPVRDVAYSAIGADPFWMVTIGDDRIVLTLPTPEGNRARLIGHSYRRVLPRTVDGVKMWESGDGTAVISVEARPGPCIGSRGARFEDEVRVRLSGREMYGCGGRRLEGEQH